MIITAPPPANLEDLMKVDGKAELISGRIVHLMPSGRLPSRIAKRILRSLDDFTEAHQLGEAFGDNMGYAIEPPLLSLREAFSPDVSLYSGEWSDEMSFIHDCPTFAVEVRSEHDYGPAMERALADKRADYFEAGTAVVWDVDPVNEVITKHTSQSSTTYRPGEIADAEPTVPGWRLDVGQLFR